MLWLTNRGAADTPVIEDVQALNLVLGDPLPGEHGFVLHRTNGGWNGPTNHGMRQVELGPGAMETMAGFYGHSNRRDFPYFRIDSRSAALVVAVGWSGQWRADVSCEKRERLRVTAGQETTHFKLHPGERVRTPRILLLSWPQDRIESNSQFRRLLVKHYVPPWHGRPPLPALYTNTCFAHGGGGGWLNECNAANQIALIRALKPLGVEAVITDAGWFLGGWPSGAGNWTPDPAKYPQGMAPVAAAAKECGTIYGLWFEPERAVAGTKLYREHPEWLLTNASSPNCGLVNFGLPAVRRHFLEMLDGYLKLPGFHVYRQDCNMQTMPFWRAAEAADRQGITEMKYIAGLYEYWDAIRAKVSRRVPRGVRRRRSADRPGDRDAIPHPPGLGVLRPEHGQPGVADGHRAVPAQRPGDDAAVSLGRLFLPFGVAVLALLGLARRRPQVRHGPGPSPGGALSAGPSLVEQGLVSADVRTVLRRRRGWRPSSTRPRTSRG